jgi:inorganic pyrophosphatase
VDKLCKLYSKVRGPGDLPEMLINQIAHFFAHYKDLEAGKWVKIDGWFGEEEAKAEIVSSLKRYEDSPKKPCF